MSYYNKDKKTKRNRSTDNKRHVCVFCGKKTTENQLAASGGLCLHCSNPMKHQQPCVGVSALKH